MAGNGNEGKSATSFNHIRSAINSFAFRSPKTETTDDITIVYCIFEHPKHQVKEIP